MEDTILHKHILIKDPDKSAVYRYAPVITALLAMVSEVPESTIAKTRIYPRSRIRYIPFYAATRGGGAITLGNKNWHSITFTENFFSADKNVYGSAAYANKLTTWLRLSAHEVGHLNHARRFGSLFIYLIIFAYQYILHGHDAAPLEQEAEIGRRNFIKFYRFIGKKMDELILSDLSDDQKIDQLNIWWQAYNDGAFLV